MHGHLVQIDEMQIFEHSLVESTNRKFLTLIEGATPFKTYTSKRGWQVLQIYQRNW